MPSYSDNYKIIKQTLQNAFLEQDLEDKIKNIKKVQSLIDNYLKRYKIISQGIRQRYQSLAQTLPNQSESARRYQAVKSYNENVQSIQDLLKEGYLYVDALREAFTGESISYRIGIKENNILYEGTLDILELVQHSTLDVDSRVFIQNAAKLRMAKVQVNQLNNVSQSLIQEVTSEASSLYSAVYNYLTGTLHKTPKINEGNAYQTYRRALFERNGQNEIPPAISFEQIDRIYEEVKRNNAAYYKGGDIADIQVKYLGGSPPSLTSLASIKRVLEKSNSVFNIIYQNSKPKKALIRSFVNLFTQKQTNLFTDIEKAANEKAKKTIEERIKSIAEINLTK